MDQNAAPDYVQAARPIRIIGHCHPDTDAICSAIAYSRLKAELEPDHRYIPCRAGLLNRETKFVLNYFGVEVPELFTDISPQISDVDYRRMPGVDGGISLRQAWVTMRDRQADTLCVVDGEGKLVGLVTMRDMTTAHMDMIDDLILAKAGTSYKNLIETLNADVVLGEIEGKTVAGHIVVGAGSIEVVEQYVSTGDVVIVSNRADSQLAAIEMGAGCIVVCTGAKVSRTICMFAEERGCIVLSTPFSTYAAGQMIVQAAPIRHYMVTENLLTVTPRSPVESAIKVMASVRHRYFPILDDEGRYLGMVSRRNQLPGNRHPGLLPQRPGGMHLHHYLPDVRGERRGARPRHSRPAALGHSVRHPGLPQPDQHRGRRAGRPQAGQAGRRGDGGIRRSHV